MNKLQHYKMTKLYLRKVMNYRKNLLRLSKGKNATENMIKTIASIDYMLGTIKSFDRMMNYISQKKVQNNIIELIPSNKPGWKVELEHMVFEEQFLQGKVAKQNEINF